MMNLPQNCANCAHFDGDCHCALPVEDQLIGYISDPYQVVCAKWTEQEEEEDPEFPLQGYGHEV